MMVKMGCYDWCEERCNDGENGELQKGEHEEFD